MIEYCPDFVSAGAAKFLGASGRIHYVSCNWQESRLQNCYYELDYESDKCSDHSYDAGVICYNGEVISWNT